MLASMRELLDRARRGGYALGYFESWDQYSLEGAIAAAEAQRAPAIIGFGAAVTDQAWLDAGGIEEMAILARALAERAQVPAAVLFNEGRTLEQARRALEAGCNAVMLDTSELPYEKNVALTQQLVKLARERGASVEAELGHLGDASRDEAEGTLTDPVEAELFVAATGVDALAVSVGNAHLVKRGALPMDLALLERIQAAVPVALVLHGGTGLAEREIAAAIAAGVAKINVGTRLKRMYLAGIREALPEDPWEVPDVHPYVGSHEEMDVLGGGQRAVQAEIERLLRLYGAAGKALARAGRARGAHP